MTRESTIERYLRTEVTKAGGTTRKMEGRINDPDRIVLWPAGIVGGHSRVDFVELKSTKGKLRKGQIREHTRLRTFGANVRWLNSEAAVDAYVKERTERRVATIRTGLPTAYWRSLYDGKLRAS